jgi:hypothetical protein
MVDGTSQTNYNLTFYATRLYNKQLSHARVVFDKKIQYIEENFQGIIDQVKLEGPSPSKCGCLLLHAP